MTAEVDYLFLGNFNKKQKLPCCLRLAFPSVSYVRCLAKSHFKGVLFHTTVSILCKVEELFLSREAVGMMKSWVSS